VGPADGTVVAWLPAAAAAADPPLWHVEHEDGDQEDLGRAELNKALSAFDDDLDADPEEDDSDSENEGENNEDDADEDDDEEDEEEGDGETLWPTWGYRHGWIRTVENCKSHYILALAINALMDVAIDFGVAIDTTSQSKPRRQANKWQTKKSGGSKKTKRKSRSRRK